MNDEEIDKKIFRPLNTRIESINKRTKIHTIQIRDLEKEIKELKKQLEDKLDNF